MLRKTNLRLLLRQLEKLAETPYLNPELDKCLLELIKIPENLLGRLVEPSPIPEHIAVDIEKDLWALTQYLAGSTTKQIPHEVVFSVTMAAEEWIDEKLLITTAIVQERNFYFKGVPHKLIELAESHLGISISAKPTQIELPYIYRHKPLFCTPIFHEVGHYIDTARGLTKTSLAYYPELQGPDMPGMPTCAEIAAKPDSQKDYFKKIIRSHRAEYFADIFAAMYVGSACEELLRQLVPNQQFTSTHPSNESRRKVVQDFLNGHENPIVEMFKAVAKRRLRWPLERRFKDIDISTPFAEVRPITPKSKGEIFGLLAEAWKFLMNENSYKSEAWVNIHEDERERIVNDLVEKSIRNYMVKEAWGAAADKERTGLVPGLIG